MPVSEQSKRKIQRPHEFIEGKKCAADLNIKEFMYSNMLQLENMIITKSSDLHAFARHLSFICIKSMQGYQSSSIIEYDYALRGRLESMNTSWPEQSDIDLSNRFLKMAPVSAKPERQQGNSRQKNTDTFSSFGNRCIRWNNSEDGSLCKAGKQCKYEHACLACGEKHTLQACNSYCKARGSAPKLK